MHKIDISMEREAGKVRVNINALVDSHADAMWLIAGMDTAEPQPEVECSPQQQAQMAYVPRTPVTCQVAKPEKGHLKKGVKYLSIDQVAEKMGVSHPTVKNRIEFQGLQATDIGKAGRSHYRIAAADLRDFRQSREKF